MDNDIKAVKKIRQMIKWTKFRIDYRDIDIMSEAEGNDAISEMINGGLPGFVGRGGANEMRCIGEYLANGTFSDRIKIQMSTCAGFFPTDSDKLKLFCELYMDAISKADIVSLWGVGAESKVVHKVCEESKFTQLHALEPYYFTNPWSAKLKGKRVLVVHPFKETIENQYIKRKLLFPGTDVLPDFGSLTCIKAVQSSAGEKTNFETWFEALDFMEKQISKTDFDVAIIGAGAYSLPLAAFCKTLGKQAIQMSGATQILFGIRGKRWDEHPTISQLYNEAWVRPSENETPKKKTIVEGGSYW